MATRIETPYTRRAWRPVVPAHVFTAERDRALDRAPTRVIPLDMSGPLRLRVADAYSPHNDGDHLALLLIVQDGGLHSHTRTMGFSE